MGGLLRRILVRLALLCEWLAMALLVAATSLIMMQVFAVGLFNTGLPWADELARYSGLGVIFLTVPLLLARDGHVKVDMFFNLVGGAPRRLLSIVNELLILAFCVMFLVSCYWFMQRAGRFSTPALGISNLFYYGPAIAGMVLTTLIAAERVVAVARGRPVLGGEPLPGTAEPPVTELPPSC
ncbi:MAG TPA: TRAP transporter small permease [Reyranella sp.]|nr:TRAP transporter small permease [Reyranella sp.]